MTSTVLPRPADAFDVDALRAWLETWAPALIPSGARITVRQFPGGFSNLTFLLHVESDAGPGRYVLRRPPRGARAAGAHDMGREHELLRALHPLGVPVPRPLARCDDERVIGAPFYIMEHVDGVILRGAHPPELSSDETVRREQLQGLSRGFVRTIAGLHAVDVNSGALHAFARSGSYVVRQTRGWTTRWVASQTDPVPDIDDIAAWLDAHRPPDGAPVLVHNDFKFDNLVLDRDDLTRVAAILDWEMATVGDPLMDLGTSLAYWVEADDPPIFRSLGLGVTALPGSATRAEIVRMYASETGRDTSNALFCYVFGLFKVAVIAQQIYARHAKGHASDPRFARLNEVVAAFGAHGTRAIADGRI
ncbi:MAG TPA: phosphotransferase family protein [Gemmatimonas sp.]|nr:phosphotransferase family protein [Gemmatimonas sp.]